MGESRTEVIRHAFLITQIGSAGSPQRRWADDVRHHVVEPAVQAAGLKSYRSDLDRRPGPISGQMVRQLAEAEVVIADLTGRNPNVYYELGIAHTLTKPVVVLIDDVAALPFDTQDERSIELESVDSRLTAHGAAVARSNLQQALEIVTAPRYQPSNAVVQAGLSRHFEDLAKQGGDATGVELLNLREEMHEIRRQLTKLASPPRESSRPPDASAASARRLISHLRRTGGMTLSELIDLINARGYDAGTANYILALASADGLIIDEGDRPQESDPVD